MIYYFYQIELNESKSIKILVIELIFNLVFPQGSALGPLLSNIEMIDLFYECQDSKGKSYGDDTTPYSCATDVPSIAFVLQASASKLFRWFKITI